MDLLTTDPMTGRQTGLDKTVRRALEALVAAAPAVRGLPRMTRDLDVAVMIEDAPAAWRALRAAGLQASTPTGSDEDPEPMTVFVDPDTDVDVDLLVASGDPEASAIEGARAASVFGTVAPVATLEHLLLLYLYSNQPKHLGDFATIVQSGDADLAKTEEMLAIMHPEMLPEWKERVTQAKVPPAWKPRPPRRPRKK